MSGRQLRSDVCAMPGAVGLQKLEDVEDSRSRELESLFFVIFVPSW